MTELHRKTLAEFVGTTILVLFGVGTAVFGINKMGDFGVAVAFGFVLLTLAYAIGPVSGCHVNPAVTLGVLMRKGMAREEAVAYWIAQFAGGLLAAAVLKLLTSGFGDVTDQTGSLGTNNWGVTINGVGAFCWRSSSRSCSCSSCCSSRVAPPRRASPGWRWARTPRDQPGRNPTRRSIRQPGALWLGPAIFNGGEPLKHVWLFIIAPLIGGGLAALVAPLMEAVPRADSAHPTRSTHRRGRSRRLNRLRVGRGDRRARGERLEHDAVALRQAQERREILRRRIALEVEVRRISAKPTGASLLTASVPRKSRSPSARTCPASTAIPSDVATARISRRRTPRAP